MRPGLRSFLPTAGPLAVSMVALAIFGVATFTSSPGWAWLLPGTLLSTGLACMSLGPTEAADGRDGVGAAGRDLLLLGTISIPVALVLNLLATMLAARA